MRKYDDTWREWDENDPLTVNKIFVFEDEYDPDFALRPYEVRRDETQKDVFSLENYIFQYRMKKDVVKDATVLLAPSPEKAPTPAVTPTPAQPKIIDSQPYARSW
jgi:hypothetical protein